MTKIRQHKNIIFFYVFETYPTFLQNGKAEVVNDRKIFRLAASSKS